MVSVSMEIVDRERRFYEMLCRISAAAPSLILAGATLLDGIRFQLLEAAVFSAVLLLIVAWLAVQVAQSRRFLSGRSLEFGLLMSVRKFPRTILILTHMIAVLLSLHVSIILIRTLSLVGFVVSLLILVVSVPTLRLAVEIFEALFLGVFERVDLNQINDGGRR